MPVSPERLLSQFENVDSMLEPDALFLRLDVLDHLDLHFPMPGAPSNAELASRAHALRLRLEAANQQLYQSIRSEILQGTHPALFTRELSPPAIAPTGNQYDHLDELLAGVFAIPEPDLAPTAARPDAEQVSYQPTPARHIFALIRQVHLTVADTIVDLGCGLGHVPLLVSACTGAYAVGIELETAHVASARQCAQALHLERASFETQDARNADLSSGTVFYLYTPFTGSILRAVLDNLRAESATRQIRVCTFGPCVHAVGREGWLTPTSRLAEDRITVFLTADR